MENYFIRTIQKHKERIEAFGLIRFKNGLIEGRGRPEVFAKFNEDQSVFILTLSRNSPRVMTAKAGLTKSFSHPEVNL